MKPFVLLTFLTVMSLGLFAQSLDDCGKDDDPKLTETEATFLNEYIKDQLKGFDFSGKKIIFVMGSNGNTLTTKSDYFNDVKEWKERHNDKIATSLISLTNEERLECGYDAILTMWVKVFTPQTKTRILNKVKKQTSKN